MYLVSRGKSFSNNFFHDFIISQCSAIRSSDAASASPSHDLASLWLQLLSFFRIHSQMNCSRFPDVSSANRVLPVLVMGSAACSYLTLFMKRSHEGCMSQTGTLQLAKAGNLPDIFLALSCRRYLSGPRSPRRPLFVWGFASVKD